ncbi:MAG: phosphate acyltransferase PlsX [bacterium]
MTLQTPALAVDLMGADGGAETIIKGCSRAIKNGLKSRLILFGREEEVTPILQLYAANWVQERRMELRHFEGVVTMTDKPTLIMRRGKNTSMWNAIAAVKSGEVDAAVSSGNTGALMAMSVLQLRTLAGVDRPAITALWPNRRESKTVVLDVGANVEATQLQLVQFAIMGEAYFRALTGKQKPTVGLLNVGAEELKGHELIRTAAEVIKVADPEMAFKGFVEGDDIAKGTVDVVVTDGFTGNIALKSAEGTARMVADWVRSSLTGSIMAKLGALLMIGDLRKLRNRMDPSNLNGAPLLGLNGLVVKSHGGTDEFGVASALQIAENLARQPFQEEIKATIAKVAERQEKAGLTFDDNN